MAEDSLNKRYIFKLSANLISLGLNIIIQAIVPRGLGPKAYGNFNFLTNFFQQVIVFLDLGTSLCFYTKLSQRPKEKELVAFYFYFVLISSLIIISLLYITCLSPFYLKIWPDQKIFYIYLAACWGLMTWYLQIINYMSDAYGLTVKSERGRIAQKFLSLIIILLLFFSRSLNLTNYFLYHFFIIIFLYIFFILIINRGGYPIIVSLRLSFNKIKEYVYKFFQYCSPLFIFAIVGLIAGIFDRWILQYFAGSIEQGFYGLSYQIGRVCFMFTSAMTPLIIREFSIAFTKKNINQMAYVFRRYVPLLYSIAAFFSCFIAIQADKVIHIMGGNQYSGAYFAVAVMSFYPIHQTYGQLSGSVFLATGQTSLYGKIGIICLLIGMSLTYFFIAPENKMGLNAGAVGLAIKMVIEQFISINVQLYYNSKFLNIKFFNYLGHQIFCVFSLLIISIIVMLCVDNLLLMKNYIVLSFLISGIIYSMIVFAVVYFYPVLFGIYKEDIYKIKLYIFSKATGGYNK